MVKKLIIVLVLSVMLLPLQAAFSEQKDITKDQVISIATLAAKGEGLKVEEAEVIYDEGGKLWLEKAGFVSLEDQSPNHGILKKGFLKNYLIVYFDFKEPINDAWVFVDKDTGEVLSVYKE
ncbi:hypothetical protein D4R78_05570 [bacterium]|nr:MAG: hypothetical protein D4R78_05570 [bacterium]